MCPGGGAAQLVMTGDGLCDIKGGGGAGTTAVDHGQGAFPGGGGAPRALASLIQSETAGFAFDGNPDLAEEPSKLPFASNGFVAGCMVARQSKSSKQQQGSARMLRLTSRKCYGNM